MSENKLKLVGTVGGFPEYLPAQQRAVAAIMAKIAASYESFGYTPLETAAVERVETLISKGISAKEVYGLRRLAAGANEDGAEGAKELALRFDLTVPMARYVSENYGDLIFPFRRYQMQPVWRGERPQSGRYRQFYQCDIDMIGDGKLPLSADAEVLACAATTLDALGLNFKLRINNRKLLEGLLRWAGAESPELVKAAMQVIDNAEKLGWETTTEKLAAQGGRWGATAGLLVGILQRGEAALGEVQGLDALGAEGLAELRAVVDLARAMLPPALAARVTVDLSIARGLDYYTGTVVETRLEAAPQLGSICSGGRYENLTASLGKKVLPGVGVSIGLSRLLSWLLTQAPWYAMAATPASVLVTCQDEALHATYADVARRLRAAGHAVEQHPGGQALGTQLKNGAKRGIRWAVLANAEDAAAGRVQVKDLDSGAQVTQEIGALSLGEEL